jgi:hypothetical protein
MVYRWLFLLALVLSACAQNSTVNISGQWEDRTASAYAPGGPNCSGGSASFYALATFAQSGQSISGNIRLTDPNNNSNTISLDVINGAISGNSLSLTVRDNTGLLTDMSGSFVVTGNNLTGSLNGSYSNGNGCRFQFTFNFTKR